MIVTVVVIVLLAQASVEPVKDSSSPEDDHDERASTESGSSIRQFIPDIFVKLKVVFCGQLSQMGQSH